ncbi:MAG TPA: LD-carboxypeptidase, partial [Kofleriaceae bacterium]|nr:LD-carboxypeptidase [Kofleriaceae bacterium]
MAVIPPKLSRGDVIGIVAPAGPVKTERLTRGLERLGDMFRIRVAPSVLAPHPVDVPSYLNATDDVRLAELVAMLADHDVRAVWFARGG